MILDSSAIVALLLRQDGHEQLLEQVARAEVVAVGTPTLAETGMVLVARLGVAGRTLLARFLQESEVREEPFTSDHWSTAVDAFHRFGKGRHPANLTFGDCLTYATVRLSGQPLLCLGEEFSGTDLTIAR